MKDSTERKNVQAVLDLVLNTFGMKLPETHYDAVFSFIEKRTSEEGISTGEYLDLLAIDREEYIRFVETITINESYFFRDSRHFSILADAILPELFQKKQKVKIWSAAAASGEEALSLSAVCRSLLDTYPGRDYTVYASDINVSGLDKMKRGQYNGSALREDGSVFHHLLKPFVEYRKHGFSVKDPLLKRVVVCEHNLFNNDYSALPDDFDIVFLRNVFIYMPIENRHLILKRIVSRMREGGYLFLSSSEVPLVWHPLLKVTERDGTYFFKRVPAGENAFASKFCRDKNEHTDAVAVSKRGFELKYEGKPRRKIDTDKLYELVNCRLYNPVFQEDGSPECSISETIILLIEAINKCNWKKTEDILDSLETQIPGNELILFYRGIVKKHTEESGDALLHFRTALERLPSFWPARYESAMLQKADNPEGGRRQFALCKKHINTYLSKGSYRYHFLLDGFNALYFMRICDFWESKLSGR